MPNSAKLQQCLNDWPLWGLTTTPIVPEQIRPLPQGLTNQGYLITVAEQSYVLRIAAINSAELGINREAEYQIQQLLEQHLLVPKVIYRAPDNSYWLREYVEGAALTPADLTLNTLLEMANYLTTIHQLAASPTIPIIDLHEKIPAYQMILGGVHPQSHSTFNIHHSQLHLCHMDPTPANWIRLPNGQLMLLDWEYAGLGNPLWDMATLLQQAQLTPQQEADFLCSIGQENNADWQQAKQDIQRLGELWYQIQARQ